MTGRKFTAALLIGLVLVTGLSVMSDVTGDDSRIRPPLIMGKWAGPYDPDQLITSTLHDYKRRGESREHETTGRFTTFSIPRKYLYQAELVPDGDAFAIRTILNVKRDGKGSVLFETGLDDSGREIDRSEFDGKLSTKLSSIRSKPAAILAKRLPESFEEKLPFDGYNHGSSRRLRSSIVKYHLIEAEYCGFDVFEPDVQHKSVKRGTIGLDVDIRPRFAPPMSLGRILAYPSGASPYDYVIECRNTGERDGYCNTELAFNDYIVTRHFFRASLSCSAPQVFSAYHDFITKFVSASENQRVDQ